MASIRPTVRSTFSMDTIRGSGNSGINYGRVHVWHAKVALINYAAVEMHQSDRVLRQFGCRQPIPVEHEVFDDHHKIDLPQLNTDWTRFWSEFIEMWEDRYAYIPNRELIIVPELACVPKYMPWFRIHGKPYLLSPEERQQQLRNQRERRGPLNPRRRDDDAGPPTMPRNSPSPSSTPIESTGPAGVQTQSPDPAVQPMIPMQPPFQMMPGAFPSPFMYPNPYMPSGPPMYRPTKHEGSSGSSSFYQSPPPYGFQTPSPLVMQTPPHSQFYQGGSSS
ncbi:hypothetical protein Gotur_015100 [Gossypium turneri]